MLTLAASENNVQLKQAFLEEALRIWNRLDDKREIARITRQLAQNVAGQGDFDTARKLYDESLSIYRELKDRREEVDTLDYLGLMALNQDDYPSARAWFNECLTIARAMDDNGLITCALTHLGIAESTLGDYEMAHSHLEEGLRRIREDGDRFHTAYTLDILGTAARDHRDYKRADNYFQECMLLGQEMGTIHYYLGLLGRATTARAEQDYVGARAYCDQIMASLGDASEGRILGYALYVTGQTDYRQRDLGAALKRLEQSIAIFRRLGWQKMIEYVTPYLGRVHLALGDTAPARALFLQGLEGTLEKKNKYNALSSLDGIAALTMREQPQFSTRLLGAVEGLSTPSAVLLPLDEQEERDHNIASVRAVLGQEVFSTLWEEGRAMSWEQAIAYALEA